MIWVVNEVVVENLVKRRIIEANAVVVIVFYGVSGDNGARTVEGDAVVVVC